MTIKTPFPNQELILEIKAGEIYEGMKMVKMGKGMPRKGYDGKTNLERGDLVIRFAT